jgi:hypothetical protein
MSALLSRERSGEAEPSSSSAKSEEKEKSNKKKADRCMQSIAMFPSMSAASERLFSCASFHETARRANISWDNLESLIYIRYNWKLLDIGKVVAEAHRRLQQPRRSSQPDHCLIEDGESESDSSNEDENLLVGQRRRKRRRSHKSRR